MHDSPTRFYQTTKAQQTMNFRLLEIILFFSCHISNRHRELLAKNELNKHLTLWLLMQLIKYRNASAWLAESQRSASGQKCDPLSYFLTAAFNFTSKTFFKELIHPK
jgi:hypothetical protein